jgi:hypothetical protein
MKVRGDGSVGGIAASRDRIPETPKRVYVSYMKTTKGGVERRLFGMNNLL